VVQKLVQNYLFQRGNIFYFRYVLPPYIRELCPQLPTEIKRSLRTDSHTTALALVSAKLPSIRILRDCVGRESVEGVLRDISDFKSPFQIETNKPYIANETKSVPLLSGAWSDFSNWKSWTEKQLKANQRMFDNLIHLLGDVPVDKVTKSDIKIALNHIARLPQRNKKNYAQKDTQELLRMDIPEGDLVSGKYVKEHLKLYQSLFSRYLKHELDILSQLLKSEISIGEYNTKIVGAVNTFESEFAVVDANYVERVNAQIQRQAAIRQQALHSAIQDQQNQSLINAIKQSNRKPQNLICNTIGTVTTCN